MTRLIALAIGAGIILVGALENPAHSKSKWDCKLLGELAETVAIAKYAGTPLETALAVIPNDGAKSSDALREMIVAVYEMPRRETAQAQMAHIAEIKYVAMALCNAG